MLIFICSLSTTRCSDSTAPSLAFAPSTPDTLNLPATIDATGMRDVTHELNAYLATVPDGSVIQFPAGARYRVEGTLLLRHRRDLTIEGNNALIFASTDGSGVPSTLRGWPRNRYHLEIRGGSRIVIRNLSVRGANPNAGVSPEAYVSALEAQHGFAIHGATDIELDHVSVSQVYGDFVYIGGEDDVWSRDIHVHSSHFERNGRQGIAITKGRGVLIERNYLGDTRRATFDLEPPGIAGGALDVVIRNNEIGDGRLKFLAAAGRGPNVSFTVENNILHRPMTIVVETSPEYRRGPIQIIGNTSNEAIGSPRPGGMQFERVDELVIRDNYQPMQGWRDQAFVMACESTAVDILNNEVPGAGRESDVRDVCAR